MANMDRVLELQFRSTDEDTYFQETHDWSQPHVFQDARHVEKIEGKEMPPQGWRMKERMKTVSVALVLCLNVGVDPPGLIKLQPCARLECWVDPLSLSPQKALEQIGQNLQKQYERWQPRARYKQSLDPTVDEVKKLCVSLRRNAKEERVLFHYNGHGVPCPTTNGEIWVFNRNYTQYIPLSIYDLQTWMGYPSIYVYDCNNAGIIIKSFGQFAEQHEREYYNELKNSASRTSSSAAATPSTPSEAAAAGTGDSSTTPTRESTPPPPNYGSCIQLGACSDNQVLPMNPDLPADLFTACLTTPIKMALRWFVLQNQQHNASKCSNKLLGEGINLETVERVPGQLNDRRTMLGELNWIFTAITDTIAWNILPRSLFQKLFRQDLLVASLFRNFLLAERIMRSYDCTPVSSPKLPPTSHHPMWHAWDYALDQCLTQLKARENLGPAPTISDPPQQQQQVQQQQQFTHSPSPFFEEQLTAFEVWLTLGNERRHPPEQLPIVLQVLLSQVHRVRALELLGKFLDLGWWAVNLALSVGIFPYVLKLLQSSAKELRPLLVFIWAKILAVDQTCQTDLVRDGSHKYFIQMVTDTTLPPEYRTMAVFVLSNIVRNYQPGQQASLQANSIATCLLALEESDNQVVSTPSDLHKWVCICLGLTWQDFPSARWCGVRDSAHEKIATVLRHSNAEVRAAAVFALGSFINGIDRTEHSNSIDHNVVLLILNNLGDHNEASALVRQEIVVALHNFVLVFENQFVSVAERQAKLDQQMLLAAAAAAVAAAASSPTGGGGGNSSLMSPVNLRRVTTSNNARMRALLMANNAHGNSNLTITGAEALYYSGAHADSMRRVASSSSLSNLMNVFIPPAAVGLPSSATAAAAVSSAQFQSTPPPAPPAPSSSIPTIYTRVFTALLCYERDPFPGVAIIARAVLEYIRSKAAIKQHQQQQQQLHNKSFRELDSSGESCSKLATTPTRTSTPLQQQTTTTPTGTTTTTPTTPSITPIIGTKFINWCWSQFSRPSTIKGPGVTCSNADLDPQDPSVCTRNWVYSRNAKVRRDCFKRVKNFPGKIEEQVLSRNLNESLRIGGVSSVKFHPYENLVVVGGPGVQEGGSSSGSSASNSLMDVRGAGQVHDKSTFIIFEYDDTSHLSAYTPYNQSSSSSSTPTTPSSSSSPSVLQPTPPRPINKTEIDHMSSYQVSSPFLSSFEWLNSHDSIVTSSSSLLAVGCNDGCVRVYRPKELKSSRPESSQLVTAWSVSNHPRVNNLLMRYDSERTTLVCSHHGNKSSVISVWDVASELLVREIGGEEGGGMRKLETLDWWVSCLDCNRCEPNVFVLGGEDGTIRMLDLRVRPSESITSTWRDFHGNNSASSASGSAANSTTASSVNAIQCVKLRHDRTLVCGSSNGRVRFFDLRSKTPTKTVETTMDVTALDIHGNLPYFGVGTTSSTVHLYGFHGQTAFLANSIREGFGGFGRIGLASNSISSMAFHDFKPFVCFVDSYSHFSVYKAKK